MLVINQTIENIWRMECYVNIVANCSSRLSERKCIAQNLPSFKSSIMFR